MTADAAPDDRWVRYVAGTVVDGVVVPVLRRFLVVDGGTGAAAALAERLDVDPASFDADPDDRDEPPVVLRRDPNGVGLVAGAEELAALAPDELAPAVLRVVCQRELRRDPGPEPAAWIHGAAVTDGTRTILVVGESGAGKSTITAHLCARGFDLVTDEQFRLLPAAGSVASFTRPVLLKGGSAEHAPTGLRPALHDRPSLVRPEELGTAWAVSGRPTELVFPRREDGAPADVVELGPSEAARRLALSSLDLGGRPEPALAAIGWLAATAPAVELVHASSAEAVELLLARVPDAATDGTEAQLLAPPDDPTAVGVHRDPAVLTLDLPDGAVLLHRDTRAVVRLNPAAIAVWCQLPSPDGPTDALEPLLDDLVTLGLAVRIDRERAARRRRLAEAFAAEPPPTRPRVAHG
jgi:hypothetical protein